MGDSRAPEIAGVAIASLVISMIGTSLRIYCRAFVIKAFAADDWLAVAAQISFIIYIAHVLTGIHYGTGQHYVDIPVENFSRAMQAWWTCEPLYVLSNMALKASIAIFLLRLCVLKIHKIIIWTVFIVTEVYSLFFFILFVLQCRPTSYFWDRYKLHAGTGSSSKGTCIEGPLVSNCFIGYSGISCVTDWTFSILPIFLIWNLQMNQRTKTSVILVLAAGALASSATIVRLPYLQTLNDVDDFLYSTAGVAIWSTLETGIGITASSLATLRPLFQNFFGISSTGPSGQSDTNRGGKGYIRSKTTGNTEAFQRHENLAETGVITVIEHGEELMDLERGDRKGDNHSEASMSLASNCSQSNLAKGNQQSDGHWNVTIQKTVVQTHG
ncbi:hypothetical protein CJF31_00002940 [Rutstroemia sp. NJR-2017a BVV2]|nr:hypothetical protein CJF31_00002940 [Rutstroemia sp. NJR-2017a BVV2]